MKEGFCMPSRYLTKSRFKLAMECPAKLYYTGKSDYADRKLEDPFLAALAEGGFQIGELAKYYFPGGREIRTLDYDEALRQTGNLLQQENAILYEAAFRFEKLFIRADILIKTKNHLDLIEVKAKSFDPAADDFLTRQGNLVSKWAEYLYDVAFQKHVVQSACPGCSVSAWLMLADKAALCPTDGLNQKFKIVKDASGRKGIRVVREITAEDLSVPLLQKVSVDDVCDLIYDTPVDDGLFTGSFFEYAGYLSEKYALDEPIPMPVAGRCAQCEFRATTEEALSGLKDGFKACWKSRLGWTEADFLDPTVLELANFRKKDVMIAKGIIKLRDLDISHIEPKKDGKLGISQSERQWLQASKVREQDDSCWIDRESLKQEMDSWKYPLHFIDFETAMAAIPFNRGRHPYEGLAFQFSHHVVHGDGRIEHRGQYLDAVPGHFPNYDFVRQLKSQLENDDGTIFRYAAHENTYLNLIFRQLQEDRSDIPDRETLCGFIQSITHSVNGGSLFWKGDRDMVDLWELVKRYYYDPFTHGSNSIKYVLPAILNRSPFLQKKYSRPVYGAEGGIPSSNYRDWTWIVVRDGKAEDPYRLLPKMFQDLTDKENELLSEDDEIRNGGAALTAYARMQFEEMSDYEREQIRVALLKYCELDTLAMVMIYEGWKAML
jgi:hypothetical protein